MELMKKGSFLGLWVTDCGSGEQQLEQLRATQTPRAQEFEGAHHSDQTADLETQAFVHITLSPSPQGSETRGVPPLPQVPRGSPSSQSGSRLVSGLWPFPHQP